LRNGAIRLNENNKINLKIMLLFYTLRQKIAILLLVAVLTGVTGYSQKINQPQPVWWFGVSGAANFNFYRGTTQMLNGNLTVPTAFHKGAGVRPYFSLLTEYRPNKIWGGMLNVAYDNRGGKFNGVEAPCNCAATLSTNISYVTIEPSLRIAPFGNSFYIFAGPTVSFNVSKSFTYTQQKQADTKGDWSDIHSAVISAQAGAGVDIPLSAKTKSTQMVLSPFVSFLTDFGHDPRSADSWSFYTIRTGVALKFGRVKKSIKAVAVVVPQAPPVIKKEIQFSIEAPTVVAANRKVKETFPLCNAVFFDEGSAEIPKRYVLLSKSEAVSFNEQQLQQDGQSDNSNNRSSRQLAVYHNILNIIGARMLANPQSTITLTGAAYKNPEEGKMMAENIKQYLVTAFGINASRISTAGRNKPIVPSEHPGGKKDLVLLREDDHRVDITTTSPELLMQAGEGASVFLKSVEITTPDQNPLDSLVIFNVPGADTLLKSWSVQITDKQGNMQYYGPYTKDEAAVLRKTILGNNTQGSYKILMTGETNAGDSVKKESHIDLVKSADAKQEDLRYSILFNFDKSKTIASYKNFITEVVVPHIPENGTVIIYGHTDIIGDEKHNLSLSDKRVKDAQEIIEQALSTTGKTGIKFETHGSGADADKAPFENGLPEERFYNRTVIINIIPAG
jgi:outer membrane protein OmpA-like peptidoglycan-associated protein